MRAATPLLVAAALLISPVAGIPASATTLSSLPTASQTSVTSMTNAKTKQTKKNTKKTKATKKSKKSKKQSKKSKKSKQTKQTKKTKKTKQTKSAKKAKKSQKSKQAKKQSKKAKAPKNTRSSKNAKKPNRPKRADKAPAKRTPAAGNLQVWIKGAPRGSLHVRGRNTHLQFTTSDVVKLRVGSYTVRATRVTVDGDTYAPRFRIRRVRLHKGGTSSVVVTYDHVGSSAPATPNQTPSSDTPPAGELAAVYALVNEARSRTQQCGTTTMRPADPLNYDAQLGQAAQLHAQDMAENNYFEHTSLDGRSFIDRIEQTAYRGQAAGENIALGFQFAQEVVDGWLASPGHCENLMNPRIDEVGLGSASRTASQYAGPVTYWVQDFGYADTNG